MRQYRGYMTSRPMRNGTFVPQRIQNALIREYCEETLKGVFLLSATEYSLSNSWMMLNTIIENELPRLDGVTFFSKQQMPDSINQQKDILETMLAQGKSIHFSLEGINITNTSEKDNYLFLECINELSKESSRKVIPQIMSYYETSLEVKG